MPLPTVDQAFITGFESQAHVAYQRTGTRVAQTVRQARSVPPGQTARFQKYGFIEAGEKPRHGKIPIGNPDHSYVECPLSDRYAGTYVDNLDLLKLNIEERQLATQAVANACGRVADNFIIATMDAAEPAATTHAGPLTKASYDLSWASFENKYIPDDGQRYSLLSPGQWNKMEAQQEFANLDYIPESDAIFVARFVPMKRFKTFNVYTYALNDAGFGINYHRSAFGFATGQSVRVIPSWENKEQSWLMAASFSAGSCLIDVNGVEFMTQ